MNSDPLVIVVIFRARPGVEDTLRSELLALIEPTLLEAGCLNYDLHEATNEPGVFYFHETWASVGDHQAHRETPHVQRFLAINGDLVAEPIREIKGRLLAL